MLNVINNGHKVLVRQIGEANELKKRSDRQQEIVCLRVYLKHFVLHNHVFSIGLLHLLLSSGDQCPNNIDNNRFLGFVQVVSQQVELWLLEARLAHHSSLDVDNGVDFTEWLVMLFERFKELKRNGVFVLVPWFRKRAVCRWLRHRSPDLNALAALFVLKRIEFPATHFTAKAVIFFHDNAVKFLALVHLCWKVFEAFLAKYYVFVIHYVEIGIENSSFVNWFILHVAIRVFYQFLLVLEKMAHYLSAFIFSQLNYIFWMEFYFHFL